MALPSERTFSWRPNILGMEGPVMSASKIPVRIPRLLPPEARRAVTRDLPTPPLPLTTPTTRATLFSRFVAAFAAGAAQPAAQ